MIFGRCALNKSSAFSAVNNTSLPILLMHGEDDSFVPCWMSRKIYDACASKDKFLFTFKDADHGLSYMSDNEKYESAYNKFIALCIDKFNKNNL